MSEQRPSRQEMIRRRRRTGFVGRRDELEVFRNNFTRNPADEAYQFAFHVHGNAGVGKSSLIRQWEDVARQNSAITAYIDDDVHSPLEAMEAVSAQLGRQGSTLKGFDKALATYRQRRHEAETTPVGQPSADSADVGQEAAASPISMMAAQVGLAGLGLLPGVGAFTGAVNPQQVAQGADRLRMALSARFRNHDDVQLVMSPLQVLTPVFLEDLAEVARRQPWIVLFFDVYERTGPVLDNWLRDILTTDEYGELPVNVQMVLSGQGRLNARCWGDLLDLIVEVPLEVFTEAEARQLLAAKGITDEQVVEVILRLSGRLPVLVDTLAQKRPPRPDTVGDPSGTAVERFLKWESDPHRRAAALACALPLVLDEDIYRAAVPEAAAGEYAWLHALPFVTGQAGRCRYHEVVRASMLRLQRVQSPTQWQAQHTSLADTFQQWRNTLEASLSAEDRWSDTAWREHRLNETYHRLCANPQQALPLALLETVHACDCDAATLRRWTQIIAQAGQDTGSEKLADLGKQLHTAAEEDAGITAALTLALATGQLSTVDQALAYSLRGREHSSTENYAAALNDYATALTLNPCLARAHYGRGNTHLRMDRYDEALSDFTRALELDPSNSESATARGHIYWLTEQYEEALTDHTLAIELAPSSSWAIANRGQTYHAMERYDEALADFNRAIELDPTSAWAIGNRGETYRDMERYDEALADFNRAIEIRPTNTWPITNRGETYRDMERYDEALADFNRAIEIRPTNTWPITIRGETYRAMERYDEALADFNRAIEIRPTSTWAITNRGETYRAMERYDEALADFNRAIEIDPEDVWAIANRAGTYRAMERYDEALADFNRAIEIDPTDDWIIANRGETYRDMERYDEALADFNRAIEIDLSSSWAIGNRGQTYHAMERYDEALADFNRAIEIAPEYVWAITRRAETYRAMERYDEALADFNRAIEIDPEYIGAITHRAETYRDMERYDEALADFNRAIEIDLSSSWAIGNRGQTYHAMERYDEALADFNRAIEISPEYVWAITNRGETYRDMERYDEALADFNRAIEIRPTNTWPITSRGETYRLMERWDDARRDIELALAINPELLHANFEAAILVSALEGLKQAKHEWEKLAQLLKNATGLSPIDRGAALFITSSALAEWDRADELLNSLTNDNRRGRLIAELSKLLKELAKYSDVNTGSRLNAYCTQIESFGNNNTHP